MNAEAETTWKN